MAGWSTRMVETARGVFEVFVKGKGAPLCVTHHYSEYNESGDRLAELFTKRHQVFLVNLREAGHSARAERDEQLSLVETVEDLEAIREALGFASWSFAGQSTGGMIGVVYGVNHGASLDSLVLIGAAASKDYAATEDCIYHQAHPQYQKMQDLIEELKRPDLTPEERTALSVERTKLSLYRPERYEAFFAGNASKKMAVRRIHYFSVADFREFDYREQLGDVHVPTLIVCGRHDVQCPLRNSVEMEERMPDARLVVFEESNHYPHLEEREKFEEVIVSFCQISK